MHLELILKEDDGKVIRRARILIIAYLEVEVSVEHARTVLAFETLLPSVHLDVLVQVRLLGEGVGTVSHGALVRAFVCVDSKMVEEVVPLAEVLSALLMVALQDLDEPLGLRVLERKNPELLRVRDVLLDLNRVEVEGLPSLDVDRNVLRDFPEGVAVRDVSCEHLALNSSEGLMNLERILVTPANRRFGGGIVRGNKGGADCGNTHGLVSLGA